MCYLYTCNCSLPIYLKYISNNFALFNRLASAVSDVVQSRENQPAHYKHISWPWFGTSFCKSVVLGVYHIISWKYASHYESIAFRCRLFKTVINVYIFRFNQQLWSDYQRAGRSTKTRVPTGVMALWREPRSNRSGNYESLCVLAQWTRRYGLVGTMLGLKCCRGQCFSDGLKKTSGKDGVALESWTGPKYTNILRKIFVPAPM